MTSPELGAPFSWEPTAFTEHGQTVAGFLGAATRLNGRVVYANAEHRFFRVEAAFAGGVMHECFKF